jgi:hypothetical protein
MAVGKDSFADRSLGRSAKSMFADCPIFGRWQRVLVVGKAEFSCSESSVPRLYCLRHGHYPSLELTGHGRRLHSLKPPQLGFDSRSQQRPAPSDAVVPSIAWLLSPAVVRRSSAAKAGATFLADVDCHARDAAEPLTRCAPESSAEAAAAVVAAARCDVQPELLLHACRRLGHSTCLLQTQGRDGSCWKEQG